MKRFIIAFIGIALLAGACQNNTANDNEQLTTPSPQTVSGPQQTAGVAPGSTPEDASRIRCGVERAAVKNLSDPDVGLVNFAPVPSTIDQLSQIKPPTQLPVVGRIQPAELVTYTITGVITQMRVEGDSDYHLVIMDPTNHHTMIIESVNPVCSQAVPQLRAEMAKVRADIVTALGQPGTSGFTRVNRTATVTGVFFSDFCHGQTGRNQFCTEIHPILNIVVN